MNRFFEKTKGSISLFLAIILLPTTLLAGILIDVANRHMSKAMVESAGELAASSVLANYDSVLEDVYGLFAVSQDYKDLEANVKRYIADTLTASGIIADVSSGSELIDTVQNTVNEALDKVKAEDINDSFINVKLSDVKAAGMDNSSLAQTAVMKNQIVEFMKYRGVQVVTQDLLSTINQFKSLDSKSEVANAQMDVNEELADLSDVAQAFYKGIVKLDEKIGAVEDQYAALQNKWGLNTYATLYADGTYVAGVSFTDNTIGGYLWSANQIMVNYFDYPEIDEEATYVLKEEVGSSDLAGSGESCIVPKVYSKESKTYINTQTNSKNYNTVKEYLDIYYNDVLRSVEALTGLGPTGFAVESPTLLALNYSIYGGCMDAWVNFCSWYGVAYEQVQELWNNGYPSEDKKAELEQWVELVLGYSKLIHKMWYDVEYTDQIEGKYILFDMLFESGAYNVAASAVDMRKKAAEATVKIGNNIIGAQNLIQPYYAAIKNVLEATDNSNFWNTISHANFLDYLIKLGGKVIDKIENVETKNETYDKSISKYESDVGTDGYSAQMQSDCDSNTTHSVDKVQEVIDQIKAIRSFLEAEKDSLETTIYGKSMTFNSLYSNAKSIGESFFKEAKKKLDDDYLIKSNSNRSSTYLYAFNTYIKTRQNKQEGLSPTVYNKNAFCKKISEKLFLTNENTEISVPEYYFYLEQTYGSYTDADKDKNAESNVNSESDKKPNSINTGKITANADTFKVVTTSADGKLTELPGGDDDSGLKKLLKQFTAYKDLVVGIIGVCKNIGKLGKGGGEEMRDDLLVTAYIFENFSNFYDTTDAAAKELPAGSEHRQTMTNVDISPENNPLYGCEVEYILYGSTKNVKGNVDTVKNNIFAIRFMSNAIFAISDGTINAQTLSPALAIQAATLGVFPYKVAQIVLDLCLAIAESVYDVNKIMKGEKIPLFKSSNTWVMQATGLKEIVKEGAKEVTNKVVGVASDTIQKFANNAIDKAKIKVDETANDLVKDINKKLKGYLEEAIGSLSQIISSELTGLLTKVYTGNASSLDLSDAGVRSFLTNKLTSYIDQAEADGTFAPEVASFLRTKTSGIVNAVMTTQVNGRSVSSTISKINSEYQKAISQQSGTIEVNASYFHEILEGVSKSMETYLDDISGSITTEVNNWTQSLSDQAKSYVSDFVQEGSAQATSAITGFVNDTVDKYFPSEAVSLPGTEGTASGGSLGDMFNFGYKDYLRLFIFLSMSSDSKEKELLTRIGYVISINRISGLQTYYGQNGIKGATAPTKETPGYTMQKAYTYITISATIGVAPTILGSNFFSGDDSALSSASSTVTSSSFWNYTYTTTAGY